MWKLINFSSSQASVYAAATSAQFFKFSIRFTVFSQRSLSSASSKSSASDNACVTAVLTENNVVTSSQLEHMEVEAQVQSVKTDEVSEIRLFPSNLNQDGYSSESISL